MGTNHDSSAITKVIQFNSNAKKVQYALVVLLLTKKKALYYDTIKNYRNGTSCR